MENNTLFRHALIAVILSLGVLWSFSSAAEKDADYPNGHFLVDAKWLKDHLEDTDIVIVDVRTDEHFDGGMIPNAVRMKWSLFRHNDITKGVASTFVGVEKAMDILGQHGITADDTVVLYDSVAEDGGATASYIFWLLDILGHEKKKILERGIDGWVDTGFERVTEPRKPKPLFYQAVSSNIRKDKMIDGDFVYDRLGDYYYQIVDVRSKEEYVGQKGTKGLDGTPLKLGHIPTAVNIVYEGAWTDSATKHIKSYSELQELYRGLDPDRAIIVYCNSGRRSSFSYYILRLMGFENVYPYEPSWKQWGGHDNFYPVEIKENVLTGGVLPKSSQKSSSQNSAVKKKNSSPERSAENGSGGPSGGYVSCGG